uniref:Uncharacterized protein n=1 Tax=Arundo donax TaxID=35708 RepID=A0A0A9CW12_ARUDO
MMSTTPRGSDTICAVDGNVVMAAGTFSGFVQFFIPLSANLQADLASDISWRYDSMRGLARSAWSASLMSASFSSIILMSARSCAARHSAGRVHPAAKLARSSRATSSAILPPSGNGDK